MKSGFYFISFMLCLVIWNGCKKDANVILNDHPRNAEAYRLFKLSKQQKTVLEKLRILKKASQAITDIKDTLPATIYDYQIFYYTQEREFDSASYYSGLLQNNSFLRKDTSDLAKSFYRKAKIALHKDDPQGVLKNMYKAKYYYQQIGDSTSVGRCLVELGNAQFRLGDYAGAQTSGTEALKFLPKKDSIYLISTYNLIALSYFNLGDYEEALEEYKNALSLTKKESERAIIKNNMANVYIVQSNFKEALEILQALIQKNRGESKEDLLIKDNYYFTKWKLDGEPIEAELEGILDKRIKINDIEGLLNSYNHLRQYYQNTNPQKSLKYARNYLNISRKFNDVAAQSKALEYLMQLAKPAESKEFGKKYITLNDSITQARNRIKNLFAKIKYDEDEKINKINYLEQKSAVKELEVVKQKSQKIIFLLGSLFLIICGSFAFFFIRQKHRREQIQKVHDTEARLSKKVHDELANDLFEIMTLLPEELENVLDKVDNIYRRTRDISKENSEINTGPQFSVDLMGMIEATVPRSTRFIIKDYDKIPWDNLKKEHKIIIYRVLQELMVNMRKHSKATMVILVFSRKNSSFLINYRDNGLGTDLKKNLSGLRNVENRIHSLKGKVIFKSQPGKGFQCEILFPQ